jgi:hypothetical protein
VEKHRTLPEPIRRHIVALKAEHPAFTRREIARICQIRFDRRPSPHTIKRTLAESPPILRVTRRYPPYHQVADPAARIVPPAACTDSARHASAPPPTDTAPDAPW